MRRSHRAFTSYTRLKFLDNYDARLVIVTNGPIAEVLAYRDKVGNRMDWYSVVKELVRSRCRCASANRPPRDCVVIG